MGETFVGSGSDFRLARFPSIYVEFDLPQREGFTVNKRTNSGRARSMSANSLSKAYGTPKLLRVPHVPLLEPLEPRTLLSTYFVTTAADAGANSLRAAIIEANQTPGHDVIDFEISGGSSHIQLASALPTITDEVTLDGTTQALYAGSPLGWLDGSQLT